MGLEAPRGLTEAQRRRAHLTIIRRNWHLLPYDQILALLGWTAEQLAYTLREDDFFFHKLGQLKPKSLPLRWTAPTRRRRRPALRRSPVSCASISPAALSKAGSRSSLSSMR